MGVILLIVTGGALGWLEAVILRAERWQMIWVNIGLGVLGAVVAGLVVYPMLGDLDVLMGQYGLPVMMASVAGAVGCIALGHALKLDAY